MMQRWSNQVTKPLRTFLRRGALLLLVPMVAMAIVVSPFATKPANAQLEVGAMLGGSLTNGMSSCAIETVGWVICPTMLSIAKLADYGFTYINTAFLKVDFSLSKDSSGTFKAWEMMRNIANGLFVIAFMALIYSQITGRSSGGYSIKRILPRLIICAILVNLSYYICVLFVEATNIVGDSLLDMFKGLAAGIGKSVMPIGASANAFQNGTLATITSQIMGKTGYAWVLLAPTAAVVITIATVCAAMLMLLILRKVIVAMLILASPVLFVAYLLPNTERFFFQGTRLFLQLLILYPIVALLLGAGQIVSTTIVSIGTGDTGSKGYRVTGDNYLTLNGGSSGSAITDLTGAAAAVLPLLGVWFLFKGMNSLMSTAGARLSATVAGRRGGDKEARVTGKATSGAANAKNPIGIGGLGRKQPFSRSRRRRSLGDSVLTGDSEAAARPGTTVRTGTPDSALQNAAAGGAGQDQVLSQDMRNNLQDAQLTGDGDIEGAVAAAVAAAPGQNDEPLKTEEEEKGKTAKDIFNNLNKAHESKDKDRKLGAGPEATGGSAAAGSSAQPAAPGTNYKAPTMAQGGDSGNIVSGSSAPAQPVQVIAIPVQQVDGASLLGQNKSQAPPDGVTQPPISGTEEKAKARAQKYLFDADKELEEAQDSIDILGGKDKHDKDDG